MVVALNLTVFTIQSFTHIQFNYCNFNLYQSFEKKMLSTCTYIFCNKVESKKCTLEKFSINIVCILYYNHKHENN